jgi:hypothetical protein
VLRDYARLGRLLAHDRTTYWATKVNY